MYSIKNYKNQKQIGTGVHEGTNESLFPLKQKGKKAKFVSGWGWVLNGITSWSPFSLEGDKII